MNRIQWFLTPYKKKLEITMKTLYANKQRLHIAGFVLDFEKMTLEYEGGEESD